MPVQKITFTFYLMIVYGLCSSAYAQQGIDGISRGKELADSLCSECHDVEKIPSNAPKTEIPSFVSIANRQGQTPEKVVGSLIFPHPEMPKVSLTNKDLKDLSNYIMSLKYQN